VARFASAERCERNAAAVGGWPGNGLGATQGRETWRTPSVPDRILAATAELAGLTVLHADKDFELIADMTGQNLERLATS
jgi:predicted nucleic acid-binding protein